MCPHFSGNRTEDGEVLRAIDQGKYHLHAVLIGDGLEDGADALGRDAFFEKSAHARQCLNKFGIARLFSKSRMIGGASKDTTLGMEKAHPKGKINKY